ncbi:hypothetical protein SynSYN20_01649 [Synechococcus sp. SYN20]|uniref:collagen-like triple helix repeat-containing protein n=1 Tax=Synechococcus sp. SYN20 TaxID=1050714 RepID=UPI0016446852|nr:collagen-like protein [Synechococcus sp. SYN20]QNJ25976.1 hypothetical protein SynSYN20_01649 [Synechococcus sp. SYN20]
MASLDQLKKKIQGNPVLKAAIGDGSIRIIYKEPPVIDEDRLFRTWTLEVLIVDDSTYNGLIQKSLETLGFDASRKGDKITAVLDEAITASERQEMEADDRQERKAAKVQADERRDDLLIKTLEAMQAKIDALEEKIEFMSLVKAKGQAGPPGRQGPSGAAGRDGQDLLATDANLQDLNDVSDETPKQGQVVMYQEATDSWELRFPPMGGGGGGGGGAGGGQAKLQHWTETSEGHLVPNGEDQNLGSPTQPVREIYVTGNTVYMDNKPLSINENERISFDGNQLGYGDGDVSEAPENSVAYVRRDGTWIPLDTVNTDIELPTSITAYPSNYANIVIDLDTGLLVAVEPEDVISPEG